MTTLKPQILVLLFLIPLLPRSQNAIEPYAGYGIDPANKQPLSQVNIGLQYPAINCEKYQMLIGVNGGLPLGKGSGNDIAYTPDPSLPLSAAAGYKTRWYSCAVSLVHRFKLISWADKNTISLFVKAGFAYQSISVSYGNYNKGKYTVLDPRRSLEKTGPLIGGGIQYKYALGKGSIFAQTDFSSPVFVKNLHNYSYKLPVPFAINIGYVVDLKKRKQ